MLFESNQTINLYWILVVGCKIAHVDEKGQVEWRGEEEEEEEEEAEREG